MGRLGNPEEVAEFILWLCSDKNTYISGQNLIIDGGFVRV
jgi:3-oxoacyl-[acyl-carrier protein] reductase